MTTPRSTPASAAQPQPPAAESTTPGDPVAEALSNLRAAGAKNMGQIPTGRRRAWGASGKKTTQRTQKRPTRLDGRADRSYRDPKKANDLLTALVKEHQWGKKFSVGQIMNAWPELVGDTVAQHTTPTHYDEKNQRLTIQCDSTSWATNLRLMQTRVLQSITRKVGPDVVAEVKILGPHIARPRYGKLRVKGRGPRDDFG